jgi:hypothetical protein
VVSGQVRVAGARDCSGAVEARPPPFGYCQLWARPRECPEAAAKLLAPGGWCLAALPCSAGVFRDSFRQWALRDADANPPHRECQDVPGSELCDVGHTAANIAHGCGPATTPSIALRNGMQWAAGLAAGRLQCDSHAAPSVRMAGGDPRSNACRRLKQSAVRRVVGQPMRSPIHRQLAVRILMHPHRRLDEVRPRPAPPPSGVKK